MGYKRIIINQFGGRDVLKMVEADKLPEPGPGEVRVKVLVIISERMPLADVRRAHELIEEGAVEGKIVLTVSDTAA
ncbi:MAG: zinc-binding dehydrogenase [Desulfobacterales bacterium]|nr:zinc-binding dehydrogenase [Desulfobacterales bacterium]